MTDGDIYTVVINENGEEVFTQNLSDENGERDGSGHHIFSDLNGDGQIEIVVFLGHVGSYSGYTQIKVLDTNGKELHKVSVGYNAFYQQRRFLIADLDNDGDKEIILSTVDNRFLVYDHTLRLIASLENVDYYPHFASDIDGDNHKEILVTDGQNLQALSLNDNTLIKEWTLAFDNNVGASVVTNLDNDSQAELIVTTGDGKLHFFDF
ncbi:cell surface protein [Candidatus Thiomargarita nelsonii]|uniref:Cell surface protein n=1 Tax=Candidatus Thiomargarita nelsonii TaxID=1003181 RepID=A0A176S0H5_9GAMM|nr:cell surface protein [Candidatus Thiomargarita nelsonii]